MRSHIFILLIALGTFGTKAQVKAIKSHELNDLLNVKQNELIVVNFWATWCGPCVKELPYFEEANSVENVRVLLVSLDYPEDIEKVTAFATKKFIASELYLLNEKDPEPMMKSISSTWTGVIPATLLLTKSGKKVFYERAFTREELFEEINKYLN